jgi:hypothetical protein
MTAILTGNHNRRWTGNRNCRRAEMIAALAAAT